MDTLVSPLKRFDYPVVEFNQVILILKGKEKGFVDGSKMGYNISDADVRNASISLILTLQKPILFLSTKELSDAPSKS